MALYIYARGNLILNLIHLPDYEYQVERWKYLKTNNVPESEYDTLDRTLEGFLDKIT